MPPSNKGNVLPLFYVSLLFVSGPEFTVTFRSFIASLDNLLNNLL